MAAFTIPSKFTAVDKLTGPIGKMQEKAVSFGNRAEKSFARAERKARALNRRVGGVTENLSGMQKAFGAAFAVMGGSQVVQSIDNMANLESQAKNLFGVGNRDAEKYADQVQSISARFQTQEDKVLQVSNAVSKQLNIGYDKAFTLIEQGFRKGADAQGEFMDILKEFPGQLEMIGLNAKETFSVITQSQKQGFFSDKGIDSLKEARVQLTEMNKPAQEAVNKIMGSEQAASEMTKRLNTGETNVFQEIQRISKGMKEADKSSKQLAIANIFRGAGEDAQGFIENLHKINTNFDDIPSNMTPASLAIDRMQDVLIKVKNTLSRSLIPALTWTIEALAPVGEWMVENRSTVQALAKAVFIGVGAFLAYKTTMFLVSTAFSVLNKAAIAYNTVMGISAFVTNKSMFALRGNRTALIAYSAASKVATAAQWAWNAALNANPIGLIITAVAALIGLITLVVKKWDSWGAAVSVFMGPLGLVISLIQSFRKNWDMIKKAFETQGVTGALKAIGLTILDALIVPVQQLLELVGKLPTWLGGGLATQAAEGLGQLRKNIQQVGEDIADMEKKAQKGGQFAVPEVAQKSNPKQAQNESIMRILREDRESIQLDINDPNNRTEVKRNKKKSNVKLTKTVGAFAQ